MTASMEEQAAGLLSNLESPRGGGVMGWQRKKKKQGQRTNGWTKHKTGQARTRSTRWLGRKEPFVRNRKTGRCLTGDPRCATEGGGGDYNDGRWEVVRGDEGEEGRLRSKVSVLAESTKEQPKCVKAPKHKKKG